MEATRLPVIVVLDNVRSAFNVGLVFRLCDSVNVRALWLGGITAYPGVSERADNRLSKTGVGGSLEVVDWRHFPDPAPAVRELRDEGWHVVAVEQGDLSTPWRAARYETPLVVVFGHEREGVRESLLDLADELVELPMRGITNSLNVAVCAGVVLYEILARHEPTPGESR